MTVRLLVLLALIAAVSADSARGVIPPDFGCGWMNRGRCLIPGQQCVWPLDEGWKIRLRCMPGCVHNNEWYPSCGFLAQLDLMIQEEPIASFQHHQGCAGERRMAKANEVEYFHFLVT